MTDADVVRQIDDVATRMNLGHDWADPRACIERPLECMEKLARAARYKGICEAISAVERHISIESILAVVNELRKQEANEEECEQVLRTVISLCLEQAADTVVDEDMKPPFLESAADDAEVDGEDELPDLEPSD